MADIRVSKKLGANVRQFRKQKGFTLHTLALATQADKLTLMQIEKSEISPSKNLVQRLAVALDVSVDALTAD